MTDMCANALYLARGDVPHTWPKGVVGDLEALLRDEPTWMEHYLQIGFGQTSIPEETRARFEEASLRRSLDASLAGGSHRGASTRS